MTALRHLCLLVSVLAVALPRDVIAANSLGITSVAPTRAVALEVAAEFDGPDKAAIEREVQERLVAAFEPQGIAVDPADDERVLVVIGWKDETRTSYHVRVTLARAGEVLSQRDVTCEFCSTSDLFDRVVREVEAVVAELPPEETAASPSEPMPVKSAAAPPVMNAVPQSDVRRPRLTRVGWAGVGLLGTGAVMAAAGAGLWAAGVQERTLANQETRIKGLDLRPPGIALVAVGAPAALAGVVMLIVDAKRRPTTRGSRSSARWHVQPGLTGLSLHGRF